RRRQGTTGRGRTTSARRRTARSPRPRRAGPVSNAMTFTEPTERIELRSAVAAFAADYGPDYYKAKAEEGAYLTELWREAGKLGYPGGNIPEEDNGGGGR